MIYIRVDANPVIATGHVMRCLSIAKEIVKLGETVMFLTADQQAKELIESNGFPLISLSTEWNNLDGEIDKLIRIIQKEKVEKILIDSYYVTEMYLKRLGEYTKILYMDDLAMFPYPVDTVINYNNYANELNYSLDGDKHKTNYLLGCSYAPLRDEFQNIICKPRMEIQHVLVTTGGSDSFHIASKFLNDIVKNNYETSTDDSRFQTLQFHVVVGRFNKDKDILIELANRYPQIKLYFNVSNMAEIMQKCDLAITAGGSTMYELCACGVPMITYAFADNQLQGVEGFEKLGVARYCGDVRTDEENLWSNIEDAITSYMSDYEHRMNVNDKMKKLVDGKGAIRLARFIVDNE